jgi:hypothetical protein
MDCEHASDREGVKVADRRLSWDRLPPFIAREFKETET